MKINVAHLLVEGLGATLYHEIDEPPHAIDEDLVAIAPVVGRVKLTRTNRGILADAELSTCLRQQCSRCLEPAQSPVTARFVEEYYPTVDLRTGHVVSAPEGGMGFMLTEAHELDLFEPFRQYVLIELPMKPLCQTNCAGLCARCGHNLNEGPCRCQAEPADVRLGPLAEWLQANRLH